MIEEGADSLFLTHRAFPAIRRFGHMKRLNHLPLDESEIEKNLSEFSTEKEKTTFLNTGYVTFFFRIPGLGKFLAKWYKKGTIGGAVINSIRYPTHNSKRHDLPSKYLNLDNFPGIHLISGSARSGRSSTLATMIDRINIEETFKICIIHTGNFPDCRHKRGIVEDIVIGPGMTDLKQAVELAIFSMETDCVAIDGIYGRDGLEALFFAARCGLYCYATVFGQSVETVIQNILYEWSHEDRKHILTLLSKRLNWILCQGLLPKEFGKERALAFEFMRCSKEVRTLIEIDRLSELKKAFSGDYSDGQNIPMEKSLANLYFDRYCSLKTIKNFASSEIDEDYLNKLIERGAASLGSPFFKK
ncbi:MAG: hypothetical protein KAW12_11450 [Candidatus Aminicenantes bacterium]|nr:hypothetical protein [Candidatus Aminicenantes bacterium]